MSGFKLMNLCFLYVKDPVAFRIGSVEVRWYGIILTAAMLLGLLLLIIMSKKKGISTDDVLELFLWIIPLAVILARVIYVLANNKEYGYFPIESWDDFVNCIAIWDGGITIYGGILGGILGILIFCKRKKISMGMVIDMLVPIMLLCQSIGRWGNFCNQEAYGQLVLNEKLHTLPFAVYIDSFHVAAGQVAGWYQATFLYEAIFNFCGAILTYFLWRKNKVDGALAFLYIVWYCVIRLILDHLRVDGLPSTKIACVILIPVCTALGIIYYRRGLKKLDHDKALREVEEMLADENN
ncbi:MAG: prolipoprotein diacylglyceryl transferase [Eubacteriales bacterium]|nr:prolipoprotein diacylglyceryl transferase [Christensenellaceae bacterium]MDD7246403.1 prolipoprotein diacylglyceryl transferase [Christensenellaceae bacterium]MDY2751587.1 prolipoprotein diacylglyceryl transferase [Eubacteriales bacterium]MDY3242110.1 prolipoprotein diacylglyceryl transferase [Eubacteriales bacterium]